MVAGDSELLIVFDGWQINGAKNLIGSNISLSINMDSNNEMEFYLNGKSLVRYVCDEWSTTSLTEDKSLIYKQDCRSDNSRFSNSIKVNWW